MKMKCLVRTDECGLGIMNFSSYSKGALGLLGAGDSFEIAEMQAAHRTA